MEDKDHGQSVAGRIVFETEAVGVIALAAAVAALVELGGAEQWYAIGICLVAAALAFGLLANAVLRR